MDFTPKQYLLIYALVVTSIVVSFFFVRRNQNPTRLNLTARPERPQEKGEETPTVASQQAVTASVSQSQEKSLNVFFQWNGHAWDAYEVLGLPAGSPPAVVQKAYQELLTQSSPESLPFFKAAYETIIRNSSRS